MLNRKRFYHESLIFEVQYISKRERISNDVLSLEDKLLSSNKNFDISTYLKKFRNSNENTEKSLFYSLTGYINKNLKADGAFLSLFPSLNELYSSLSKVYEEKPNELPKHFIDYYYAPTAIDLLGVYGAIKNKVLKHPEDTEGKNEFWKNIDLDVDSVYDTTRCLLTQRINQVIKESNINLTDNENLNLSNDFKGLVIMLGKLIYNYALYNQKVNKRKNINKLVDYKLKGIPLINLMDILGYPSLTVEFKILKFDYIKSATKRYKKKKSSLKGLIKSANKYANRVSNFGRKKALQDIIKVRKLKLLRGTCRR